LNGVGNSSVPSGTQRKVFWAAKKLGYVPNWVAQSLRTRRTKTIACIVPDITNPFYPSLERGAQNSAETYGYDMLTYNTDGLLAKEEKCLGRLLEGRVDGVIGVFFHLTARDLYPLLERKIAIVRIEANPKKIGAWPLDNLFVDNIGGARAATQYLIEQGHCRIAMIAGTGGPESNRVSGYLQALGESGLKPLLARHGDFNEEGGYRATKEILSAGVRPTAIFAANDLMALGAMTAIREVHLTIPDHIALMGFDDIFAARFVTPPLSTINMFQCQLGRVAADMVIERLNDLPPETSGRQHQMPFEVVRRQSA
ncbi:MAG: LacI family DNA-binding transcriptional regulator, partial [Verrucomicrobia bacterium]|nr:LacI family DNA-binding transcriptional regulator [Verrucomicrobiota bacterium]